MGIVFPSMNSFKLFTASELHRDEFSKKKKKSSNIQIGVGEEFGQDSDIAAEKGR